MKMENFEKLNNSLKEEYKILVLKKSLLEWDLASDKNLTDEEIKLYNRQIDVMEEYMLILKLRIIKVKSKQ